LMGPEGLLRNYEFLNTGSILNRPNPKTFPCRNADAKQQRTDDTCRRPEPKTGEGKYQSPARSGTTYAPDDGGAGTEVSDVMDQITFSNPIGELKNLLLKHGPLTISCREFEDFIIDYCEDDLTPRQRRTFDAHLKVCEKCQDYLGAYCSVVELTKRVHEERDQFAPEPVSEHLIEAILVAREA